MKLLQLFSYCSLAFFTKTFESLFNTVLGQDGLIFDDVGWWSGLNKGNNIIYDVDIILPDILEGMGDKNLIDPYHRAPIGSPIILVDGGRIL